MLKKILLAVAILVALGVVALVISGVLFWNSVVAPMKEAAADLKRASARYAGVADTRRAADQPLGAQDFDAFAQAAMTLGDPYDRLAETWIAAQAAATRNPLSSMRTTARIELRLAGMIARFAEALSDSGLGRSDYLACAVASHSALRELAATDSEFSAAWSSMHDPSSPSAVAADMADFFGASKDRERFEAAVETSSEVSSFIDDLRRMPANRRVALIGVIEMTPLLLRLASEGTHPASPTKTD